METATRRILANLVWIGLILAGRALAQETSPPAPIPQGPPQAASRASEKGEPSSPAEGGWIVGEEEPDVDAVFGNRQTAGCEICGGGQCVPPRWSVENDIRMFTRGQGKVGRLISERSDSTGPFQVSTAPVEYRFFNDTTVAPRMYTDSTRFQIRPSWQIALRRYLGRDGDDRDHFLEVNAWGFSEWEASLTVTGSPIPLNPHFDPDTPASTDPNFRPVTLSYEGDLRSPFRLLEPIGTTPNVPSSQDAFLSDAFNRAQLQSYSYTSTLNNFELNTLVKSANQEDQLVLHPNGRWYRQCRSGFHYSYLVGLRAIVVDEKFEFLSSGGYFSPQDPNGLHPLYTKNGRYVTRTENVLLGVQVGGNLEYRFCKWAFDFHGKAGPCVNVAEQQSHLHASISNPAVDPFDLRWHADRNVAAVFGEIGTTATYRFNPRWVGHASYDMMWIGDLALAPDQLVFQSAPVPEIKTTGTSFYHGVTLGLEYDF